VFRIRIRWAPNSNCRTGSGSVFGIRIRIMKVKLSYKNPLFPQTFHDIHLFLKMIPNKSSLFNKILTWLDENKNKIGTVLTLWVENKNFSQNFVFAFEKMCFLPGSGLQKKSRIRIRKKRIRIRNIACRGTYFIPNSGLCCNIEVVTLTVPSRPAVVNMAELCWLQLTEQMSVLWAG